MKKVLFILFFLPLIIMAQADIRGSMGINFINTPSLRDYINQNYTNGSEIGSFNSAVNFSAESDYHFPGSFAAGVELAYIFNSFTYNSDFGQRELDYFFIMPSLTAYYILSGKGYNFKFGGGAGPRFSRVKETFSYTSAEHSSSGFGLLLKAEGNTLLGGNIYANIGTEMRYDVNGNFTVNRPGDNKINLDAFSAGIRLGLTYIFN